MYCSQSNTWAAYLPSLGALRSTGRRSRSSTARRNWKKRSPPPSGTAWRHSAAPSVHSIAILACPGAPGWGDRRQLYRPDQRGHGGRRTARRSSAKWRSMSDLGRSWKCIFRRELMTEPSKFTLSAEQRKEISRLSGMPMEDPEVWKLIESCIAIYRSRQARAHVSGKPAAVRRELERLRQQAWDISQELQKIEETSSPDVPLYFNKERTLLREVEIR